MSGSASRKSTLAGVLLVLFGILAACSPVSRHKVLTTLFDGAPSLPPEEEVCEIYTAERMAAMMARVEEPETQADSGSQRSEHLPFAEKRCDDCHDFTKEVGLIRPEQELCFACHEDFVQGLVVHGPVSVGDCLSCHLPHQASHPSLLIEERTELCAKCHKEGRLAAAMHAKVTDHEMSCVDCHDPHFADAAYLLK